MKTFQSKVKKIDSTSTQDSISPIKRLDSIDKFEISNGSDKNSH